MVYYREKLIELINSLFLQTGDAKRRLIECENKIYAAYLAALQDEIQLEARNKWEKIWNELNIKEGLIDSEGVERISPLAATIDGKWNSSMEKYMNFFLEEFYRVL